MTKALTLAAQRFQPVSRISINAYIQHIFRIHNPQVGSSILPITTSI
jgi:hypothetical protein